MKNRKVKYIKQPNLLKLRAGHGGISKEVLANADNFCKTFEADFSPEALRLVDELSTARKDAAEHFKKHNEPLKELNAIIKPIMQLKANGGMFQYQLISDIADICLQFLESLNQYEAEALEIIRGHEKTLRIIIENNLKGDGGEIGYELLLELDKACKRYFEKHVTEQDD